MPPDAIMDHSKLNNLICWIMGFSQIMWIIGHTNLLNPNHVLFVYFSLMRINIFLGFIELLKQTTLTKDKDMSNKVF